MKKIILLLVSTIMCYGCSTTGGLNNWYKVNYDEKVIPDKCKLSDNEEPLIYYTDNYEADSLTLKSKYYDILGYASYNAPAEDLNDLKNKIKELCKLKKAKIALFTFKYTDTRSGVVSYSNNVSSYSIKRYDYHIILFFPLPEEYIAKQKIGIEVVDLDSALRLKLQRNTGVYIDVVFMESPAFYANLVHGDIIIKINNTSIVNKAAFNDITNSLRKGDRAKIIFLRNGIEYKVNVRL